MIVVHFARRTPADDMAQAMKRIRALIADAGCNEEEVVSVANLFAERFSSCDGWDDWTKRLASSWGIRGHILVQPLLGRVTAEAIKLALSRGLPCIYAGKNGAYLVKDVIKRPGDNWTSGWSFTVINKEGKPCEIDSEKVALLLAPRPAQGS